MGLPLLQAVSIVFFTETWRPDSFYDRIAANRKLGLHTLCLLDIKVKEPSLEALARGKTVYEPPRYGACPCSGPDNNIARGLDYACEDCWT